MNNSNTNELGYFFKIKDLLKHKEDFDSLASGNKFQELGVGMYMGYIAGMVDAMQLLGGFFENHENIDAILKSVTKSPIKGMELENVCSFVSNLLGDKRQPFDSETPVAYLLLLNLFPPVESD